MSSKKVIIVTGASSGIGHAIAESLIRDGHTVYAGARRLAEMADLEALGGHAVDLDVTVESDITSLVDTVIQKEWRIDVLINNAGYGIYGSVEEVPIAEARAQYEVNVFGLANMTQKVLPHMRAAKSGTIINISSMAGRMYAPLGAWYHSSKHAVEGLSDCMRLELAQFGVKVVMIEPGAIASDFGSIMLPRMLMYSGKWPYKIFTEKVVEMMRSIDTKLGVSPASVIADTVRHIISVKNPARRYPVGKLAKPMLWMRKYLGDGFFDWMLLSQVK